MSLEKRTPLTLEGVMVFAHTSLEKPLKDFIHWMQHERILAEKTAATYLSDLKQLFLFLTHYQGAPPSKKALQALTLQDFRAYVAYCMNQGLSKRRLARAASALRTFFKFQTDHQDMLHEQELSHTQHTSKGTLKEQSEDKESHISPKDSFTNNWKASFEALMRLKSPKLPKKLPRALSNSDVNLFFSSLPESTWIERRDKAFFMLLYGTGLRLHEAIQLNNGHIPEKESKEAGLTFIGKGNKERFVPLMPVIHTQLRAYQELCPYDQSDKAPLFWGARGKRLHPTKADQIMAKLRYELGLRKGSSPHALRHTFATHLLAEGVSLRHIQELLGHASLSSTQIYTDISDEQLAAVYTKAHPQNKIPS